MQLSAIPSPATSPPRIESLRAVLLPDHRRVQVWLHLTDPSSRPTIEFKLLDERYEIISESLMIGVFINNIEFTLHIKHNPPVSQLYVSCSVVLNESEVQDTKIVSVGAES